MPDDHSAMSGAPNNDQYASPVPAAIRRQSLMADEIARQAGIANVPGESDAAPPAEGEAAPDDANTNTTVVEPGGERPTEIPPTPQADSRPDTAAQAQEWQQRYHTLQGKYNTEIPELQAQLRSLERMLATIQSAPREPQPQAQPQARPQQAQPAAPPAGWEIPAEDRDAYGEELIQKTQGWAEAKLAPRLSQLETRLMEIEGRTVQTQQLSAQAQVEATMDREMPGWQAINQDPQFWSWLNAADPFSGHIRRAMLVDAHVRGDAARALAFFRAFSNEHTLVDPAQGTQPSHTAPQAAAAAQLPLETLAAPGRGSATQGNQGAPERRVWDDNQVRALYRQKTAGNWDGREADFSRLEQDILAATTDGRYRN